MLANSTRRPLVRLADDRFLRGDCRRALCPAWFIRTVAAAGAAAVPAFQMVLAGEDDKFALPVKVFSFNRLVHLLGRHSS